MPSLETILSDKSLVIVFAYAPAGLGHLRVTDALYDGLPQGITPILLGSQDKSITYIHRLMSLNPVVRYLTEWVQNGTLQSAFTSAYRNYLKNNTRVLYEQLATILDQRLEVPKTILIIATHFGLAHQLGSIKERIQREKGVKVILIVQVTDDSPQDIWYVEKADCVFVPSNQTKHDLMRYGKQQGLSHVPFEISPYPVSPLLKKNLTPEQFERKTSQVYPSHNSKIHVAIPISGAAVGMSFFKDIIHALHMKNDRFFFHVIVKNTQHTASFVNSMKHVPFVELYTAHHDRQIVNIYEKVYEKEIISLEITKPSEQAFKALFSPHKIGGSILLFAKPVGRQEYDNLFFLKRHNLIPNTIFKLSANNTAQVSIQENELLTIHAWRGLQLPSSPQESANFILWCIKNSIFMTMMDYRRKENNEVNANGVEIFWRKVVELIPS